MWWTKPEHNIQKCSVHIVTIKVEQSLNQLCNLGIFNTPYNIPHRHSCAVSLYLHPRTNFSSQQRSYTVSVQFNYEAGNACTCCLHPACHVTLSSQLLKLKFCLALLDNTASNNENMYDDDLDAGGGTHCFPRLLLLLSVSHEVGHFLWEKPHKSVTWFH